MSEYKNLEPMVEMYLYETTQLVDKLEQIIMHCETVDDVSQDIDEIFRLMHTIKGNSMMMMFDEIANVSHAIEDLFDYLKLVQSEMMSYQDIINLVLEVVDFFKGELITLEQGDTPAGSAIELTASVKQYLESLKFIKQGHTSADTRGDAIENTSQKFYISSAQQPALTPEKTALEYYKAFVRFESGCELENVRAFSIVHNLKELSESMVYYPPDIVENEETQSMVAQEGFIVWFSSYKPYDEIERYFDGVAFIEELDISALTPEAFNEIIKGETDRIKRPQIKIEKSDEEVFNPARADHPIGDHFLKKPLEKVQPENEIHEKKHDKGLISVGVDKVNQLIDLIGELVVSESMVTRNEEVNSLKLESFEKSARQHRFIIRELQDAVMSIRMVPLELTFQKMKRLVRDMSKKTGKEINFEIIGAHTEVDKKVIEALGDPLMHIIRNSLDHGIEMPEERIELQKRPQGNIFLEAKQEGGSVYIIVRDDGRGLNKTSILQKAKEKGLLDKNEGDYSEREIFNFIFQAGFSTKKEVTEFSGRGVGMDVVTRNIEEINGSIFVQSEEGKGSQFIIKIPLTLAIIEGMLVQVGESVFSLPITSISESYKIKKEQIVTDNNGNELISIRDVCYPVLRLHEKYGVITSVKALDEGIVMMVQTEKNNVLLFVDTIIGEQQLVVKNIPKFLKKVEGISGCALLGDGKIALILDPTSLID